MRYRELNTKIYRAGNENDGFRYWASSVDDAVAYMENPGFGGDTLYSTDKPTHNTLTIDSMYDLATEMGFDDPTTIADTWKINGWDYPWEHSADLYNRLQKSGYRWLVYTDDYPQDCTTYFSILPFTGNIEKIPVTMEKRIEILSQQHMYAAVEKLHTILDQLYIVVEDEKHYKPSEFTDNYDDLFLLWKNPDVFLTKHCLDDILKI